LTSNFTFSSCKGCSKDESANRDGNASNTKTSKDGPNTTIPVVMESKKKLSEELTLAAKHSCLTWIASNKVKPVWFGLMLDHADARAQWAKDRVALEAQVGIAQVEALAVEALANAEVVKQAVRATDMDVDIATTAKAIELLAEKARVEAEAVAYYVAEMKWKVAESLVKVSKEGEIRVKAQADLAALAAKLKVQLAKHQEADAKWQARDKEAHAQRVPWRMRQDGDSVKKIAFDVAWDAFRKKLLEESGISDQVAAAAFLPYH
jgi:hypothetical protein